MRVKSDIILKLKGENRINAKPGNASCLFSHAKHLLLSKTHFTTCTEVKPEAKFPVKHQSCALSSASGDKPAGPWAFSASARAVVEDIPPGSPPRSMSVRQRRSSDNGPEMLRCIGVQQGWGVILPPISSQHLPAAPCWMGAQGCRGGEQVRTGLPSPSQSCSSAPLGRGHSPDTQTQASAPCCTWVSLWAKSTSKHKLSGREGKTQGTFVAFWELGGAR